MRKLILALIGVAICSVGYTYAPFGTDTTSTEVAAPAYQREMQYKGHTKKTYYVAMDDGIRLAVNVYLPKGLKEGEKIPGILFQTRYWRGVGLKWPFSGMVDIVPHTANFPVLELPKYGYGLVTVDVRGSGASEGEKTLTLCDMREVMDSKNMIDWVVEQPWCNGNIGATGVSYIGNTAMYALYNEHPNLKAIVPTYSIWDIYDDVSAPGGIYFHQFISQYGDFCETLDQNIIPKTRKSPGAKLAYGVERVKGYSKKDMGQIWSQHTCNHYHRTEGGTAEYMDDVFTLNGSFRVRDVMSPHLFADRIRNSGAAVYSWSGWWDAAFSHAAIRQFINLDNGQNRLRLGPWNHGGGANVSPTMANASQHDDVKEIVRFFDFHLKGMDNGLDKSPRIYYYTMVEDAWHTADVWPIPAERTPLFLSSNSEASWTANSTQESFTPYTVDTSHAIGVDCRWNFDTSHNGVTYANASSEDSITVVFSAPVLTEDMEVTGHPIVSLYLKSSTPDGSVFAYLEDVDENGNVWKVTDGQFRFAHRKLQADAPYYKDVVPYHSYKKADAELMDTTKIELLTFDLLPTSHLFKKGHRIQIRLAGVDTYNFKNLYPNGGSWEIYHDAAHPTAVDLPVIDRNSSMGMK
ncbi:MAG: CocE/NonD family hydrolase [Flavobacteriales bacterium]|nr:CocE/NonD family hydrolase [Flavobacteriales bacterium]